MNRLTTLIVAAAAVLMLALPALAWHAEGWGDCDGWHVTNPAEPWNSDDLEMGVFPVGELVAYGQTITLPALDGEAERSFFVAWRKIGDGDNWKESRRIDLTRDLDECGESTTTTINESPDTTEGPSSSTTTTSTPSTSTTTPSTTTAPPSSTTSTTAPSTTTPPAPTTTAPTGSSTPATLPFTGSSGPGIGVALVAIAAGVALVAIRPKGEHRG